MKSIRLFITIACLAGVVIVLAAFMDFKNENAMKAPGSKGIDKGFAVVELFTSEGCSSCPPADDLVASIEKQSKGKQIYILAYHVDYWDHQGWKDTFSDAEYSKRQRQYATWLNLRTIYTPQIVMNGKTEFVGSDQGTLVNAISKGLEGIPAGTLAIKNSLSNGAVSVDYQVTGAGNQSDLVLVLVQKSGHSQVRAGENSGLKLSHVQIVRKIKSESINGASGKVNMVLPKDFNADSWELVAFVQDRTNGVILSAARSDFDQAIAH